LNLHDLGWSDQLATEFERHEADGLAPARVAVEHRGAYVLYGEAGELRAEVAPQLRSRATGRTDFPAVGDWVAVGGAYVHAVLPRRTKFSRKVNMSASDEQIVAANVDVVLLVTALDRDFNARRIERYLTMAWESGAEPRIVLTKSDLCDDVPLRVAEAEGVAFGVPVHVVSSETREGLDELAALFVAGRTLALLGSSGVGKSTLVNRLADEEVLETRDLRADGRGRHTTTHRELVVLPGGGLVIDTPGMRELQLWVSEEGLETTFADIEELASQCRFVDCAHETEPDCAITAALREGRLDAERLASWRKLGRELRRLEIRLDKKARAEEAKRQRAFYRQIRAKTKASQKR